MNEYYSKTWLLDQVFRFVGLTGGRIEGLLCMGLLWEGLIVIACNGVNQSDQ